MPVSTVNEFSSLHKVEAVQKKGWYKMFFNLGERIFKLRCASGRLANRWVEAVDTSMRTARELANSKTNKSRNVRRLVELHEKKELRALMESKFNSMMKQSYEKSGEIISSCKKIKEELIIVAYVKHSS
eukprot:TRINITY_DN16335_c0_g1_i3.p3 TRINITY_DN16335_c0_g1~~TRINITY_DN16335_c0_g1_i3.p3  ORF type:complete len:129 (+),score=40.25 TRINITY_DN16335_c0_g1_i3:864-1250(+)